MIAFIREIPLIITCAVQRSSPSAVAAAAGDLYAARWSYLHDQPARMRLELCSCTIAFTPRAPKRQGDYFKQAGRRSLAGPLINMAFHGLLGACRRDTSRPPTPFYFEQSKKAQCPVPPPFLSRTNLPLCYSWKRHLSG